MKQITINVPDNCAEDVDSWAEGETKEIEVVQKDGEFEMKTCESMTEENGESEDNGEGEAMSKEMNPGSAADVGGTTIPSSKNPAVAAIILAKSKRK